MLLLPIPPPPFYQTPWSTSSKAVRSSTSEWRSLHSVAALYVVSSPDQMFITRPADSVKYLALLISRSRLNTRNARPYCKNFVDQRKLRAFNTTKMFCMNYFYCENFLMYSKKILSCNFSLGSQKIKRGKDILPSMKQGRRDKRSKGEGRREARGKG